MSRLVKDYKKTPLVRELAVKIVQHLPNQKFYEEAEAIHDWVRSRVRYVKDVRGVETIQTPEKTLELGAGDCDDLSTLTAVLLEAIGHATRFVAVGFKKRGFSHVLIQTKMGRGWIWMETTKPLPMGQAPKNITSQMVVHN